MSAGTLSAEVARPNLGPRFGFWTPISVVLAGILVMPVAAVVYLAAFPEENIWTHLLKTSLPAYLGNTAGLMIGVGTSVFLTGVSTAWLVTMCNFPGRRYFEWLLLLPMAIPAYVIAYAYTDLLEYSGPVQGMLRELFGWTSARDYYFPEVRSLGGAILLMGLVLYPYVYLLARSAFLEQSLNTLEVSRVLGRGPWRTFFTVALPIARPSIAVGVALALMETLNDFGTVDYFAVQTLTAGIFDVWLGMGNLGGAAQIATVMLVFVVLLITLERVGRRNKRFYQVTHRFQALPRFTLRGWKRVVALVLCGAPVLLGFFVPVLILARYAWLYFDVSWNADFLSYAANSFALSAAAALVALALALFIAYSRRLRDGWLLAGAYRLASLGYAVPGAVLAIGIIVPFGAIDNALDGAARRYLDVSTGLILSGTVVAVIFAYVVRFLAVALGQVESSLGKISPAMDMAARTLGYRASETLITYHLPLIRGGMLTAVMIVFVDCMKELPATLILRPFNFETLATHVYQFASDELIGEASLGALTIVLVGLVPVLLLSRLVARSREPL